MATKIELEIRIRELERRLENDEQDMVDVFERIEKLESGVKKRFMELKDTPVYQMALINELRKNHDALCDALIKYSAVVDDEDGHAYDEAINRARIDTGDINTADQAWDEPTNGTQEAQDEPQSSKDVSDGRDSTPPMVSTGGAEVESVSVDAIMGEIRKPITTIVENAISVQDAYEQDENQIAFEIVEIVRPHIERLVGERDEYRRSSNDWARHFKSERTARISAEAEVARLRDVCEKLIQLDNEKLICLSGQLSYKESNKVRKAVIAMRQAIDNAREQ